MRMSKALMATETFPASSHWRANMTNNWERNEQMPMARARIEFFKESSSAVWVAREMVIGMTKPTAPPHAVPTDQSKSLTALKGIN